MYTSIIPQKSIPQMATSVCFSGSLLWYQFWSLCRGMEFDLPLWRKDVAVLNSYEWSTWDGTRCRRPCRPHFPSRVSREKCIKSRRGLSWEVMVWHAEMRATKGRSFNVLAKILLQVFKMRDWFFDIKSVGLFFTSMVL